MNDSSDTRLHLLDIYKRALPMYVRVLLFAMASVIVLSLIMPQTYTAECSVMPPTNKSGGGGLASLLQSSPITIGLGGSGSNKTALIFKDILTSRTLYEGVVDTLGLVGHELYGDEDRREIVEDLMGNVNISAKRTGMLVIAASIQTDWFAFGDQPAVAAALSADVANACRMSLDKLNQEKSVSQARLTRRYIERIMASTRIVIDSLQSAMELFQTENKVFALDEQMAAIVNNAVIIGTELAKAELELAMVEHDFHSESPQVDLLEMKVESLREQYSRVQTGGLVTTDGFSIPFEKIPSLSRRYGNLIRDIKIQEQINIYLETQRMQELIQEAKDVPTVVALDDAIVPLKKSSPARMLMAVFTWLLVTIGFVAYVPVRDMLRTKFS